MGKIFTIHAKNPETRIIQEIVNSIKKHEVVILPSDAIYILVSLNSKKAVQKLRDIRNFNDKHNLTFLCKDLSQVAQFAVLEQDNFKLLKKHTPGSYTFILKAAREVSKNLQHLKDKTVGIRIPDSNILQNVLANFDEPLVSASLIINNEILQETEQILITFKHATNLIVINEETGNIPTSIIDLTNGVKIIREGKGDVSAFK